MSETPHDFSGVNEPPSPPRESRGPSLGRAQFSLTQLAIAMLVVALIVGIAIPLINRGRESARQIACGNNLKQWVIAFHLYHETHGAFPPGGTFKKGNHGGGWEGETAPGLSWKVRLVPYMEKNFWYHLVDMNAIRPPDDLGVLSDYYNVPQPTWNRSLRQMDLSGLSCPSETSPLIVNGWRQTNYCGNLGSQWVPSRDVSCAFRGIGGVTLRPGGSAPFGDSLDPKQFNGLFNRLGTPITIGDVTDGTSYTIAIGEILPACSSQPEGWTSFDGAGNAHASTLAPLNLHVTCANSEAEARSYDSRFGSCWRRGNWTLSWGFRSRHPGLVYFGFVDGSVRGIKPSVDYELYQQLGSRNDGARVSLD